MSPLRTRTSNAASAVIVVSHLANSCLIPLLNGAAGARLGRRLAVLEYLGRRTGQHHELVTGYETEGTVVRITVGMAEHKTWWRNFEDPHPLRLRLAGADRDAVAHVVRKNGRVIVLAEVTSPQNPERADVRADHEPPS